MREAFIALGWISALGPTALAADHGGWSVIPLLLFAVGTAAAMSRDSALQLERSRYKNMLIKAGIDPLFDMPGVS